MVFKVSKGGIRSGNTLRGIRCLRTRRYSRHACIVARSNLSRQELSDLVDLSEADKSIDSLLGCTGTILSLNKKARWQLPVTLHDMITSGKFRNEKIMVALLERHKLKRTSNCVSFICNQGKIRHVVPKQKRYISLNLEKIGAKQSNRQRKIQKAKVLKAVKSPEVKIKRSKYSGLIKTVELFTVSGSTNVEISKERDQKKSLSLEAVYPCPPSCSLVYNPKYTDVPMADVGEDRQMGSKIKSTRARRRHKRRVSTKEMAALCEDMRESCLNEYSEEGLSNDDDSLTDCDDENRQDLAWNHGDDDGKVPNKRTMEDSRKIFAHLITEAEMAQSILDSQQPLRTRKAPRFKSNNQETLSVNHSKSHIIYIDKDKHIPQSSIAPPQGHSYPVLQPARVIIKWTETSPEKLRARFGSMYAEADSSPRRFVVNVTEDIEHILSPLHNSTSNTLYTSFLVFIHDGFYDADLDVFQIIFNSNICANYAPFSKSLPFEQMTIEEIMNRVVCSLLEMKWSNQLALSEARACEFINKPALNILHEALSVKFKVFRASDEIDRVWRAGGIQEQTNWSSILNQAVDTADSEVFCDICYQNINQNQAGALPGTQLSKCRHRFCDECWRLHFRGQFKDGAAKILCPGYDCEVIVGPVTLLSLLHVQEVSRLFQRICEEDAESSFNCKWCPNTSCGRIVKLETGNSFNKMSFDVNCHCGQEFCFMCLSPPHWPATCKQAEIYSENLQSLRLPIEAENEQPLVDIPIQEVTKNRRKTTAFEVEGRICPKCLRFIEKSGGCQIVVCKCGHGFCWWCLKSWNNHNICKPNSFVLFEYTRRLKINHFVIPNNLHQTTSLAAPTDSVKQPRSRQRTSMSQKALKERLGAKVASGYWQTREMANKIVRVSQSDLLFKKELLSRFKVEADVAHMASVSVASHVTRFLRSCVDIKSCLHHVAEFTFVFLQDIPDSVARRRLFRLANDISGYCSFLGSILELGQRQDVKVAVRRLLDIQMWARRALVSLISSVNTLQNTCH